MGAYFDIRRVLLHTALVVSLSLFLLKVVLDEKSCGARMSSPATQQHHWQQANVDRIGRSQQGIEDIPAQDSAKDSSPSTSSSILADAQTRLAEFCPEVAGVEDVLYIIKTGATEALERLPAHIRTTMQCWPNVMILSDFGETIENVTIHDALDGIHDDIRLNHTDFDIWRRLKDEGRQSLTTQDFIVSTTNESPSTDGGDLRNPGWKIDKYKNLPMVEKAFRRHPNLRWFVFTDADTFVSPSNLMNWLDRWDHTKPLYLGNPSIIATQTFGHGGSGYVLSQPAMNLTSERYSRERKYWDHYAAWHWAGDCVLATMLQQRLGITLSWSYPLLQSESPFALDFTENKYYRKLWCYPAVSYHHVSSDTIDLLWALERGWTAMYTRQRPLRHKDVFRQLVEPRFTQNDGQDWDNLSGDIVRMWRSDEPPNAGREFERCRALCERNSTCVQYSYSNHSCRISDKPRHGKAAKGGVRSGWMPERIRKIMTDYDDCNDGRWIVP